jgi:hypothetical protein
LEPDDKKVLPPEVWCLNRCWEELEFLTVSQEIPEVTPAKAGSMKKEVRAVLGVTRRNWIPASTPEEL